MKSKQDGFGLLGTLIVIILGSLFVATIMAIMRESDERDAWAVFMVEHDCKIVAHRRGFSTSNVAPIFISGGGMAVVTTTNTTPSQVAYECNDGTTYWRNK